jgi:hypothetical protein
MSSPADRSGSEFPLIERRRHPRVTAKHVDVSVPHVTSVEVLDISSGGAMLSTEVVLQVGQRAHLRTLLDREPFAARIEVLRASEGSAAGSGLRHRLGVLFTAFDENSRRVLQRFVKNDSRPA